MDSQFEYIFDSDLLHVKYAKGEPGTKSQEFHYYHEFVLFIGGSSYLVSKDIQQTLSPGSIVLIPKEQFHQFRVSNPAEYTRLIVSFYDQPALTTLVDDVMTRIKVISTPSEKSKTVLTNLTEILKSNLPNSEKELFIQACLSQLLLYFKYDDQEQIQKNINISSLVRRAIAYIDKHYPEKLTIDSIAQKLFVSPSTLAHNFSRELGISIYRYISKKRLLEVHKRIEQGESSSAAATKCGFADYSCYYRIYKKYHTHS